MKWLFKFSILALIHISVFGQTPEKMSYQAVIRDNSDVLLQNSNVNLKIILRQGSPNGSSIYEETHRTTTNKNGLLSLEIGSGSIEKGFFNEINWAQGPFFIETLVDIQGNTNYKINGISEMLSVPYALHAKSADSFTGTISPSQMPDFYTADEIDNILLDINTVGGVSQSLKLNENNLTISGGNIVSFENWDTNIADDFSGFYDDLQNKPVLYDKSEIDNLIAGIETTGGTPQNLNLDLNTLSISGGNSISFENWDTNAADDFSGIYDDLQNKPVLYDKSEIDNLIAGIETTGGTPQNLNLDLNTLSISGGNSISFENWDTNAADDFSGIYDDLRNKPVLYDKSEIDNLIAGIETTGGTPQNLNLDLNTLSISGGNSISFENWDTNANDDFDGAYSKLTGAPKIYTQDEVNNIKAEILTEVKNDYMKKPTVINISSSRSISQSDVGNTIACTSSATLSINSGFSAMQIGDVSSIEVHGTTLTIQGSGVIINGVNSGKATIGNNKDYTGGILRKTGTNTYIVL